MNTINPQSKTSSVDPTNLLAQPKRETHCRREEPPGHSQESQTAVLIDEGTPAPRLPPLSLVGGYGFPKSSTIWTTHTKDVRVIQSVDFTIIQKGTGCHLRFTTAQVPPRLQETVSQEEWNDLREKVDEIGKRAKWNAHRSFIIIVIAFVAIIMINAGDDIGAGFAVGDYSMSLLVLLSVVLLKLIWDEYTEHFTRRKVLNEMDAACQDYSNILRPRGVCVAFKFADTDDHGLVVDLTFFKVEVHQEAMLMTIP